MMFFLTWHKPGRIHPAWSSAEHNEAKLCLLLPCMFLKLLHIQGSPNRRLYLADVLWCLIWLTAELTTYLEVTDTRNWVSQLGELLAAQYKYCLVGFVIFMLRRKKYTSFKQKSLISISTALQLTAWDHKQQHMVHSLSVQDLASCLSLS